MSVSKKDQNPDASSSTQLLLVGALLSIVICYELKLKVMMYYNQHLLTIWLWIGSIALGVLVAAGIKLWNYFALRSQDRGITEKDETSVLLGVDADSKHEVSLKQSFRTMHAQIIGTTNAGKTESVILPWAIQDIKNGSGLVIIDGKSDTSFLDKLYAYAKKEGRAGDFKLFSLANPDPSSSFNPLKGSNAQEVTERVFSSFTFENEFYKNAQYRIFLSLVRLVFSHKVTPTFSLIYRLMTDPEELGKWVEACADEPLRREIARFLKLSDKDREERTSGLETMLSHFTIGDVAPLFEETEESINFEEALKDGQIIYFQLPTMYYPFLGAATGKLVLQAFQSAVSKRQINANVQNGDKGGFFSCILDDFQDYIYEGFGSLLNKSRSANVGVVFSHQALGDLDKVSDAFRNVVLTNTNIKIVMRMNDPDTCDHFAKTFGTNTATKTTEKTKDYAKTGDGTIREVEQFNFHPNVFKKLGTGHGVVSIPHRDGMKNIKVKFAMKENLKVQELKKVRKVPIQIVSPSIAKKEKREEKDLPQISART